MAVRTSGRYPPKRFSSRIFVQTILYIDAQYRVAIVPWNFGSSALHSLARDQQVCTDSRSCHDAVNENETEISRETSRRFRLTFKLSRHSRQNSFHGLVRLGDGCHGTVHTWTDNNTQTTLHVYLHSAIFLIQSSYNPITGLKTRRPRLSLQPVEDTNKQKIFLTTGKWVLMSSLNTRQYTVIVILQYVILLFDICVNSFASFARQHPTDLLVLYVYVNLK